MKVLVLTHRLPYAPNRGDRIRSFHIIQELARHAEVRVVSLVHDREEAAEVGTLERTGVRVWTAAVPRLRNMARAVTTLMASTPLTHTLLAAPEMAAAVAGATDDWTPDVVLAYCSGVAPVALAPPLARVPMVIDFVDVDSAKWATLAESAFPPKSWVFHREARCLASFEAVAAQAARMATVVNEREREALLRVCPEARVEVIPNGVDIDAFRAWEPPAANHDVVFSGVFNYAPNVEGAVWLAREVWPRVKDAVSDARLVLVGANPDRTTRRLASADQSIMVTGSVRDMRPYLWGSAVAVAPLFTARGVQNKVLEAVAASLPVVVTPAVWDGLPKEVFPACRRAESATDFARTLIELLSLPPAARRRVAGGARLAGLGWRQRLAPLMTLIENAAGPGTGDAPVDTALTSRSPQLRSSSGSLLALSHRA
jgi:sugar transferase (PEP-CTERM/EpsH1 system associated)